MHTHKKGRIVTAWIATFAILVAVLAPSFSFAFVSHASPWMEICTAKIADRAAPAHGAIGIAVDNAFDNAVDDHDGHDGHQKNISHLKHCPYCFKQDQANVPVAMVAPSVPAVVGGPRLAILFYQASTPLQVWSAKNPRAPPAA